MPRKKKSPEVEKDFMRVEKLLYTSIGVAIVAIATIFVVLLVIADSCDDLCKYDRAIEQKHDRECHRISDTRLQNACLSEIAVVTDTPSLCTGTGESSCIMQIAVARNSSSMCVGLSNQWESVCFLELARLNTDLNLCDAVANRDACIREIGKELNTIEHCSRISTPQAASRCYLDMAIAIDDVDACELADAANHKSICLTHFAIIREDVTLCERVPDQAIYTSCLGHFQ